MRVASIVVVSLIAAGCGSSGGGEDAGGVTRYAVSVDVRGYGDTGLVLANNGADTLPIESSGRRAFQTTLTAGETYAVSVTQQPLAQVCVVSGGGGTLDAANPPVAVVECFNKVVAMPLGLWLNTRLAGDALEQFLYVRSAMATLRHYRIRPSDGGLDAAGPQWTPFSPSPSLVSFILSPDGTAAYADDLLGEIRAAALRPEDGVIVPSWSGVLGEYVPRPPVLLGGARLAPDGRMLYRNFNAIVGGGRYEDLWIAHVDALGLAVVEGSPFPLASEGGGPLFEPSGRYFARAAAGAGVIEIYRPPSPAAPAPQLVGTQSVSFPIDTNYALGSEPLPGRWLYELRTAMTTGSGPPARPELAALRWRQDGSLERLGMPHVGGPVTGEIANEFCASGETTRRVSSLQALPGFAGDHRFMLQRQDSYCRNLQGVVGPIADTRVLGLYLLRSANAATELLPLAADALPGWADLGGYGVVHPGGRWLYVGSGFLQRVYGYDVDPVTGQVQPLPGSPFDAATVNAAAGVGLPTLVMDPTGRYLYMGRFPDAAPQPFVHAYSIDQTTGALTAVATYPLL